MSPTLLEFALIIIVIIVAWQLGIALAPRVMHALRSLKNDVDETVDQVIDDSKEQPLQQHKKEHHNGTRH